MLRGRFTELALTDFTVRFRVPAAADAEGSIDVRAEGQEQAAALVRRLFQSTRVVIEWVQPRPL